jgi:hypothetical protein
MLIMKFGRSSVGNKPQILLVLIGLAIVILSCLYFYKDKHKPDYSLTSNRVVSLQEKNANELVSQKNYGDAENSYLTASAAAAAGGNSNKGISILQDGIKNIPNQYLSWKIYDNLAALAKQTGDKSLEASSIKKAQVKINGANDANATMLKDYYSKRLKELGAN